MVALHVKIVPIQNICSTIQFTSSLLKVVRCQYSPCLYMIETHGHCHIGWAWMNCCQLCIYHQHSIGPQIWWKRVTITIYIELSFFLHTKQLISKSKVLGMLRPKFFSSTQFFNKFLQKEYIFVKKRKNLIELLFMNFFCELS